MSPRFGLIVPLYKTEAFTRPLLDRVAAIESALGEAIDLVFVDDGCPNASGLRMQQALTEAGRGGKVIYLSRNFGSFQAIRAGLAEAEGRHLVVMAADLQEPLSLIVEMFAILGRGEHDVVIGVRTGRNDPFLSRVASRLFWSAYRRFVTRAIPEGGVDMFGLNAPVAQRLISFTETHTNLIALLFWLGFSRATVPYVREPRRIGRGSWSFRRRLRYMSDSVYAFSDLPIRIVGFLGMAGIAASIVWGVIVVVQRSQGLVDQPGYTALLIAVLAGTSAILSALSIIGGYIWRGYENSKGRPLYVVQKVWPKSDNGP